MRVQPRRLAWSFEESAEVVRGCYNNAKMFNPIPLLECRYQNLVLQQKGQHEGLGQPQSFPQEDPAQAVISISIGALRFCHCKYGPLEQFCHRS